MNGPTEDVMPDYRSINRYADRAERWLLVANVLLTVLLGASLLTSGLQWSSAADSAPAQAGTGPRDGAKPSITASAVSDRIRGRAPFRTSRVEKVKEVDELGSFRVIGASIRNGTKKAYVRDLKLEKMLIKEVGGQLGSYEVVEIEREGIVLRKGSEDFVLRK